MSLPFPHSIVLTFPECSTVTDLILYYMDNPSTSHCLSVAQPPVPHQAPPQPSPATVPSVPWIRPSTSTPTLALSPLFSTFTSAANFPPHPTTLPGPASGVGAGAAAAAAAAARQPASPTSSRTKFRFLPNSRAGGGAQGTTVHDLDEPESARNAPSPLAHLTAPFHLLPPPVLSLCSSPPFTLPAHFTPQPKSATTPYTYTDIGSEPTKAAVPPLLLATNKMLPGAQPVPAHTSHTPPSTLPEPLSLSPPGLLPASPPRPIPPPAASLPSSATSSAPLSTSSLPERDTPISLLSLSLYPPEGSARAPPDPIVTSPPLSSPVSTVSAPAAAGPRVFSATVSPSGAAIPASLPSYFIKRSRSTSQVLTKSRTSAYYTRRKFSLCPSPNTTPPTPLLPPVSNSMPTATTRRFASLPRSTSPATTSLESVQSGPALASPSPAASYLAQFNTPRLGPSAGGGGGGGPSPERPASMFSPLLATPMSDPGTSVVSPAYHHHLTLLPACAPSSGPPATSSSSSSSPSEPSSTLDGPWPRSTPSFPSPAAAFLQSFNMQVGSSGARPGSGTLLARRSSMSDSNIYSTDTTTGVGAPHGFLHPRSASSAQRRRRSSNDPIDEVPPLPPPPRPVAASAGAASDPAAVMAPVGAEVGDLDDAMAIDDVMDHLEMDDLDDLVDVDDDDVFRSMWQSGYLVEEGDRILGEYEVGKPIACGSSSTVHVASRRDPAGGGVEHFALKVILLRSAAGDVIGATAASTVDDPGPTSEAYMNEIDLWQQLHHPHIVALKHVVATPECLFVFAEYLPHGSLLHFLNHTRMVPDLRHWIWCPPWLATPTVDIDTYLATHPPSIATTAAATAGTSKQRSPPRRGVGGVPEYMVRALVHQLLLALGYLHETMDIVHNDVKLENVLIETRFVRAPVFLLTDTTQPTTVTCPVEVPLTLGHAWLASGAAVRADATASFPASPSSSTSSRPSTARYTLALRTATKVLDVHLKLADFGLAQSVADPKTTHPDTTTAAAASSLCLGGSVAYCAPEVFDRRALAPALVPAALRARDVWSLGMVLLSLLRGELPLHDEYEPRLVQRIRTFDVRTQVTACAAESIALAHARLAACPAPLLRPAAGVARGSGGGTGEGDPPDAPLAPWVKKFLHAPASSPAAAAAAGMGVPRVASDTPYRTWLAFLPAPAASLHPGAPIAVSPALLALCERIFAPADQRVTVREMLQDGWFDPVD